MSKNFDETESALLQLLKTDRSNWCQIYRLMQRVEDEQLYAAGGFHSFTAWVNHLAGEAGVHVSLLWRRKKAGKFYVSYQEQAATRGVEVPALEAAGVSAEDLSLVEKIAGGSAEAQARLMDKVLAKDMTRKDLKAAWALAKAEREKRGQRVSKKTRHDTEPADTKEAAASSATALAAYDVVRALSQNWPAAKYRYFTEFAVSTGSSRHSRRIDMLIVEESAGNNKITLNGIEIKVAKGDLVNDHKMQEYTAFVDRFYIAIPDNPDLIAAAQSVRLPSWGILAVDQVGTVREVEPAGDLTAVMRLETLTSVVQKLL